MAGRVLLSFILLFSVLVSALGQQPTATPTPQPPATNQPDKAPDVESQDVVRITTNLVQVDAVVTKDGKAAVDLQPEDFEIFEDGKPQTITNFSYVSNVPAGPAPIAPAFNPKDKSALPIPPAKINPNDQRRVVALVIDDLGVSWEAMAQLRTQVKKFIDQASPNDLIAIIRTGGDVGSLQQFTNDKRVLQSAWEHLRWNPCSRAGIHVFQPVGALGTNAGLCSQFAINGTLKALRFIVTGMRYLPGRKSMILFSDYLPIQDQQPSVYEQTAQRDDSQDTSDDASIPDLGISYAAHLQRIAELAIRASVVIYGVDTRGLQTTGLTAADQVMFPPRQNVNPNQVIGNIINSRSTQLLMGREGSDLISKQTGGFLVRNSNDFGLKDIMKDQQGYYLIGFRPAEETFNRNFHHIKIGLKRRGYSVRTRAGFYGFTDDDARPKQLSIADEMNKALISPFSAQNLPLRLTSLFVDDPKQGPVVRSFLYLDPHDLSFSEADGWNSTNLTIKSIVFGDNGRVVAQEDRVGRLRFRGAGYDRASREGIAYSFDLPLKARGPLQIRVAVLDRNTSKIGSAGQFVEVPDLRKGRLAISGIVARDVTPRAAGEPEAVATGPAVRQFHQGSTVGFAFELYNADAQAKTGQLTAQMRLVRDGKIVYTGPAVPVSLDKQNDPQRLTNVMNLQLGSQLEAGNYVCQIIITDTTSKEPRLASQWIDFEIVK